MASSDLFQRYFMIADVDRDGRINGQEAVYFFRGTGLPQPVLAKIWQYSDPAQTGFLTPTAFTNALKLVTVAQSGRDLTPEMVGMALNGPAASQIPPPRISLPAPNLPQQAPRYPAPPPLQAAPQIQRQDPSSVAPQNYQAQQHQPRPEPPKPPVAAPIPLPIPGPRSAGKQPLPEDIFGSLSGGFSSVPAVAPQVEPSKSIPPSVAPPAAVNRAFRPPLPPHAPSTAASSLRPAVPTAAPPPVTLSSTSIVPVAPAVPAELAASAEDAVLPWPKMTIQDAKRYTLIFAQVDLDRDQKITGAEARKLFLGFGIPRDILKQIWNVSDVDNDGLLSLREFCSAMYCIDRVREGRKVPRKIPAGIHIDEQQQLASQQPLQQPSPSLPQQQQQQQAPAVQPDLLQDAEQQLFPPAEAAQSKQEIAAARVAEAEKAIAASQPAPWRLDPTMLANLHQQETMSAPVSSTYPSSTAASASSAAAVEVPQVGVMPVSASDASAAVTGPSKFVSRAPVVEEAALNILGKEESEKLREGLKEAQEKDKQIWKIEAELLDSKQKIEFYRIKMQEIIIFKSRCDNRLNEILERSNAEKREVEALAKKYNEKYKQTEGVANQLAQEELALKDIEEKKSELQKAVTNLLQGGNPKAHLQETADKLASELEDLRKAVNRRAKQLGLTVRPILGSDEVPFGWQPSLQENAVEWDDEWFEFVDEGFSIIDNIGDELGPIAIDLNDPFPAAKELQILPAGEPAKGEAHVPAFETRQAEPPSAEEFKEVDSLKDFGGETESKKNSSVEEITEQEHETDKELDLKPRFEEEEWAAVGKKDGNESSSEVLEHSDSGVRSSWDVHSNASNYQPASNFGRGSNLDVNSSADFFETPEKHPDDVEKEENEEENEEESEEEEEEESDEEKEGKKSEEEEEDLDPFAALIKKRAGSYSNFMNWGENTDSSNNGKFSGFDAFKEKGGKGVISYDNEEGGDSTKAEGDKSDAKPGHEWSSF